MTAQRNRLVSPAAVESVRSSEESASGDSGGATCSLTQSVLDYPTENGRRYHKFREGSYYFPNDEVEMERLELHYELMKLAMGGREFFAPLTDPMKCLDVGTGTGRWAIEMAEMFPKCEITGTDLSPIQPDWVPSNVHFVVDDASEEDWLYPPSSFDYIHTRYLLGSMEDFRDLIRKGFKYTKPGGWMESQVNKTPLSQSEKNRPSDDSLRSF
ncbi:MAG: hypothetical protein M1816_006806 [Peltula sp. TS41687]|nr:MAG: hypothetical protein M1816_006806 [Peltula sp. TS41687]